MDSEGFLSDNSEECQEHNNSGAGVGAKVVDEVEEAGAEFSSNQTCSDSPDPSKDHIHTNKINKTGPWLPQSSQKPVFKKPFGRKVPEECYGPNCK